MPRAQDLWIVVLVAMVTGTAAAADDAVVRCRDPQSGRITIQNNPCPEDLAKEQAKRGTDEANSRERYDAATRAWDARMEERRKEIASKPIPKTALIPGNSEYEKYMRAMLAPLPAATETRYPAPWRSDANGDLTIALARRGIRGCGQWRYRISGRDSGEYLVHCTDDGETWTGYQVWPRTGSVSGPFSKDAVLP